MEILIPYDFYFIYKLIFLYRNNIVEKRYFFSPQIFEKEVESIEIV